MLKFLLAISTMSCNLLNLLFSIITVTSFLKEKNTTPMIKSAKINIIKSTIT